jgi:hypothetical protein
VRVREQSAGLEIDEVDHVGELPRRRWIAI